MSGKAKGRVRFSPPDMPSAAAPREALYRTFDEAASSRRIICVSAPAGYGKSISAALWIESSGRIRKKSVWISLTPYDSSPSVFYRRFLSALRAAYPDNGVLRDALDSRNFGASPIELSLETLLSLPVPDAAGKKSPPFVTLVIDDVHLMQNEETLRSLPFALDALPENVTVMILGRGGDALDRIREAMAGKIALVGENALLFSLDEVVLCFGSHGRRITKKTAGAVLDATKGWPIAVALEAASDESPFTARRDAKPGVGGFIKTAVWDHCDEETKKFLLSVCVPDEISPDICARLTGTDTTRSSGMLEKITNDTSLAGLVRRLSGEHGEAGARYACHHLFLEFLRGEAQDMTERYAAASDYYLEIGDGYAAVACALKSGRNENIAPAMMSLLRYDEFNNSIFQHLQSMSALISILPEAKYDELPYLYLLLAWHSNLAGDARRMFRALDRLYEVIPVIEAKYPEFLQSCLIIQFLDHRIPLEKMLDRALPPNVAEKFRAGKRSWPARSKNLPFFHKGGLDLSDYTGLPVDGAHLQGNTRMWGDETMRGVLRAGLWYEKNDLAPALSSALAGEESLRDPHAVPPETVFFTKMITVAILDAMERPDEANEHREELRRHIRERGALCLIPNLTAYEAKMRMTDGDDRAASDWLEKYFVDAGGMRSLELYKIFQHLTTARALMLRRAPREAKAFLLRTIKLAEDFRRVIDAAEARSLLAILEWHAGSRETAAAVLETATESVRRYNYVRVFADEGASILPILKSCIGRLRVNRSPGENGEEETAKKEEAMRYLNEIYTAAYARSRERAGIASAFRFSMPKITVQQKTTLLYLAKGYERKGIASKMGLSLETVKTHIKQLYEKLDAHSAEEAVYAAKKLGILEA